MLLYSEELIVKRIRVNTVEYKKVKVNISFDADTLGDLRRIEEKRGSQRCLFMA